MAEKNPIGDCELLTEMVARLIEELAADQFETRRVASNLKDLFIERLGITEDEWDARFS